MFPHTEKRITWNYIKTTLAHILEKVKDTPLTPLIHLSCTPSRLFLQHIPLNPSHTRSKLPSLCIYHILSSPLTSPPPRTPLLLPLSLQQVKDTKFVDPKMPAAELRVHYDVIVKEIEDAFTAIIDV